MIDTPRIIDAPAQRTAVIRFTIPRADIRHVMQPAMTEVTSVLKEQGIAATGSFFSRHYSMADPAVFDFEVGLPVDADVAASGRVLPGTLPTGPVAQAMYSGPMEALGAAWGDVGVWLKKNGRAAQAGLWEVYVGNPDNDRDPAHWRAQLNRPLEK